MKNAVKLTLLCVLTMPAFARAADAPKLVGEKEVMKNSKNFQHFYKYLRLSPDGRYLLFLRHEYRRGKTVLASRPPVRTTTGPRPRGEEEVKTFLAMVLHDVKTGKDKPVPVPALADFPFRNFVRMYLHGTIFDASGTKMVVMVGADPKHNGVI